MNLHVTQLLFYLDYQYHKKEIHQFSVDLPNQIYILLPDRETPCISDSASMLSWMCSNLIIAVFLAYFLHVICTSSIMPNSSKIYFNSSALQILLYSDDMCRV